jgi:hypothetical protein
MFIPTDKVPAYIQKQREDFLSWHKELYPYSKENECLKIFAGSGDLEVEYLREAERFANDEPFISFEDFEEDAYRFTAKRSGQGQDGQEQDDMEDMEKVKDIEKQDDVEDIEIELE